MQRKPDLRTNSNVLVDFSFDYKQYTIRQNTISKELKKISNCTYRKIQAPCRLFCGDSTDSGSEVIAKRKIIFGQWRLVLRYAMNRLMIVD